MKKNIYIVLALLGGLQGLQAAEISYTVEVTNKSGEDHHISVLQKENDLRAPAFVVAPGQTERLTVSWLPYKVELRRSFWPESMLTPMHLLKKYDVFLEKTGEKPLLKLEITPSHVLQRVGWPKNLASNKLKKTRISCEWNLVRGRFF